VALNRPAQEDDPRVITEDAIRRLFQGLTYRQVNETVGSSAALVSEIWRGLVCLMAIALMVEAWLCLPEKVTVGREHH
jgi:hypothetical protein